MNSEMIKVEGLRKSYGDNEVLKGSDVTIAEQEVVGVIGPGQRHRAESPGNF